MTNSIAESNADLMVKILGKVGENGNIFFSPASLMYGVAMLYEGMDDRSRRVVNNALNFPSDVNDFRRQFAVSFVYCSATSTVQKFSFLKRVTYKN